MQFIKCFVLVVALVVHLIGSAAYGLDSIPVNHAVLISQVQTGGPGTGTAAQEYIEIYNSSSLDTDITNWCVEYSSASDVTSATVACFEPSSTNTSVMIRSGGYVSLTSTDYVNAGGVAGDEMFRYSGGMSAAAGHLRLIDGSDAVIDTVGWGATAIHPEGHQAPAIPAGKTISRINVNGTAANSDDNSLDFTVGMPVRHTSELYEVTTIVDVCLNIEEVQQVVPSGYEVSPTGLCERVNSVDYCPNMDDIQSVIPLGYGLLADGTCSIDVCDNIPGFQSIIPGGFIETTVRHCIEYDACSNISGIQPAKPAGYNLSADGVCMQQIINISITEMSPNPSGSDVGNEFIEFYNPTTENVDMTDFYFVIHASDLKRYDFPVGSHILPGEYIALYNDVIKFTLPNTTSSVDLMTQDGQIVIQSAVYASPKDGLSWSLFSDGWNFTNNSSPSAENIKMTTVVDEDDPALISLVAEECAPGKYRNPLTNRCRNIESDATVLATCSEDQYRSPDTNRCRKIAIVGASVVACKDNQFRSEETNRCRALASSTEPVACKEGQERNAETNRCRTVVKGVPAAAFAVTPVADNGKSFIGWWALAVVTFIAIGYALWEWRREVLVLLKSLRTFRFPCNRGL